MAKCNLPACESSLPATYGFYLEGLSFTDEDILTLRCTPCLVLGITKDWLTKEEVLSLHKL